MHPGAVLIVPVLADGRLVLERQFRYPRRPRVRSSFPAGKIDPGEAPLATAQRELRRGGRLHGRDVDAARHDPSGDRLLDRVDRHLRRRGPDARRRAARRRRVPRDRHDEPTTRCSRRSIAARSPTPRRSPRCCSTRGARRARDAMIARRARRPRPRAGRGLSATAMVAGGRRARRRRLGAQPPRRHASRRSRRATPDGGRARSSRGAGAGRRPRASPASTSTTRRPDAALRDFARRPTRVTARRVARPAAHATAEDVLPRRVRRRGDPAAARARARRPSSRGPKHQQHERVRARRASSGGDVARERAPATPRTPSRDALAVEQRRASART